MITTNVKHRFTRRKSVVVPSNPLKADPSRTATLRRIFERDMRKRFRILKGRIIKLLVDDDAFGLKRSILDPFSNNEEQSDGEKDSDLFGGVLSIFPSDSATVVNDVLNARKLNQRFVRNTHFRFRSDPQKVVEFRSWLDTQIQTDIIGITSQAEIDDAFWTKYVNEGYEKGAGRAFDDVRKPALASGSEQLSFFDGTRSEFLRQSFGRPETVEKVKLLAGRVFTDLKGVTDAMAAQMTRVLADGLVQGQNPREIARTLNDRIDKIGRTRATIIARTEIIRAHAEGQLDAMERLGVEEVGVMVEWSTAGDDRVCPRCQPMDGVVLKIKEARGLIPLHAQCRCAHIPANVGESPKGQIRGKTAIEESITKSVKAFKPKGSGRTIAEQKLLTSFRGKTIAKRRPKSTLEGPKVVPTKAKPSRPSIPSLAEPRPRPSFVRPRVPQVTKLTPPKPKVKAVKSKPKSVSEVTDISGDAVRKAEAVIQKSDVEVSYVFDKNGKVKAITRGTADAVDLSDATLEKMKDAITLHNHPAVENAVTSFSGADIENAIQTKQFLTKVITEKGHRISMSYGNTLEGLNARERVKFGSKVIRAYEKEFRANIKELARQAARKQITFEEATFQMSHKPWEKVAKQFKFKYDVEFPSGLKPTVKVPKAKSVLKPKPTPSIKPVTKLTEIEDRSVAAWISGASTDIRIAEAAENINKNIKLFHGALNKFPEHKGLVFRGMTLDEVGLKEFTSLKKGATMTYNASASASKVREVSKRFTEPGIFSIGREKKVMFNIQTKTGADISSKAKEQAEVVLRKGTKYRVTKTEANSGGLDLIIHMEEI